MAAAAAPTGRLSSSSLFENSARTPFVPATLQIAALFTRSVHPTGVVQHCKWASNPCSGCPCSRNAKRICRFYGLPGFALRSNNLLCGAYVLCIIVWMGALARGVPGMRRLFLAGQSSSFLCMYMCAALRVTAHADHSTCGSRGRLERMSAWSACERRGGAHCSRCAHLSSAAPLSPPGRPHVACNSAATLAPEEHLFGCIAPYSRCLDRLPKRCRTPQSSALPISSPVSLLGCCEQLDGAS